ncbi:ammonium transporter [Bryobacter aggregatus]|uniref:ammonium transporter n=1 Tax=Bryobacter aggregatus TaxID=360054 RepID=UPI00056B993A|nr:ammonium transporter [Bryobacter aggregatus]
MKRTAFAVPLALGSAAALFAQATPPPTLASLEASVKAAQSAGDNAWMMTSCALVLMMTGPGLALFYGGLVRKKNVLATMMQSFTLMALATVLWAVVGYSLCFGEGQPFIGDLRYFMLNGVGADPNTDYAATIPQQTWMMFQLMFAIITPALITGAFAERMKFNAMVLFMILWSFLVYYPMAHMVWGKGGFLNAFSGSPNAVPCFDFAGGTVVHITSGVSALVCAIYMGKRHGYGTEPMKPHSLVLSFIGACMLWMGWFGFNAGSALSAGSLASSAFVTTHFAAATAALGWTLMEWLHSKATVLGAISGAVAGLVVITPAAGFVSPSAALIMGFVGGIFCYYMVVKVKAMLGYDDSLDAFGVHGAGGTLGALLTGVFASTAVNSGIPAGKAGMLEGNGGQVLSQGIGVAIAWGIAIVGTLLILKICDLVCGGVRVSQQDEIEGLDLSQHGEEGYSLEG